MVTRPNDDVNFSIPSSSAMIMDRRETNTAEKYMLVCCNMTSSGIHTMYDSNPSTEFQMLKSSLGNRDIVVSRLLATTDLIWPDQTFHFSNRIKTDFLMQRHVSSWIYNSPIAIPNMAA